MPGAPGFDAPTAEYPGTLPTDASFGIQTNNTTTRLATAITSSDLTLTVMDPTTSLPSAGIITIGSERIRYSSKNDTARTFTVSSGDRGFDGSEASSHDAFSIIYFNIDAWHHNKLVAELRATQAAVGTLAGPDAALKADGSVRATGIEYFDAGMAAKVTPVYDVKAYGAKGDGEIDDTDVISLAVSAASATGGTILFPHGNYLTTGISVPANVRIKGNGAKLFGNVVGAFVLQIASGCIVDNMTIENTDTTGGNIGIDLAENSSGVSILNCKFTGSSTTQSININATGISNVLVDGCSFTDVGYGILVNSAATDFSDLRVNSCVFNGLYDDAVEINQTGANTVSGVSLTNNYVKCNNGSSGSSGFGFGFSSGSNVTIASNIFYQCRHQAIHLEAGTSNVCIAGNSIDSCGAEGGADFESSIWAIKMNHVSITGNTIYNSGGCGIILAYDSTNACDDIIICGNVVRASGSHAISVGTDQSVANFSISGNTCVDNVGSGLIVQGQGAHVLINNNICNSNSRYGIEIDGYRASLFVDSSNITQSNVLGDLLQPTTIPQTSVDGASNQYTSISDISNLTPWTNTIYLGNSAEGILHYTAKRTTTAEYETKQYWLSWNGSNLKLRTLADVLSGSVTAETPRMDGGWLQTRSFTTTNPKTILFDVRFFGTINQDGETSSSGVVSPLIVSDTNAIDGYNYISASSGAPSGIPTAISGSVPLYYNTSTDKLYAYNSGWVQLN